jgi:hypothetical protein
VQASIRFCGSFYGGRDVEFSVGEGFNSFCDTVIINGGRAAVTGGEPVLLCGGLDVDWAVDGGTVVVDGGDAVADGGDWTVGRSDGIRVLQLGRDREPKGLRGQGRGSGDGGG